jgi:peroxiredoxin
MPKSDLPSAEQPTEHAPEDDGACRHLIPGTRLPDVALAATHGADVNLARHQERAVVFVYPMTGTPGVPNPPDWNEIPGAHGSTPEAEGFRDAHVDFELRGYDVFGLSAQSSRDQRTFVARAGISYLLLSDAAWTFADALKLPRFETGGKTYLKRLTMIVRNGVIYRVIYPVHSPQTHARDLLRSLMRAEGDHA